VRGRNYESDPPQPERNRRFGGGGYGERRREQSERQRFAERSGRDEDEGFGDDLERQGFAGGAQGGWRQEVDPYGPYGQGGQYGSGRQSGPYGQGGGQGFGRYEQPGRAQNDFGQGYDRRQEWGIDRNEGYGAGQGYGSQRYGEFDPDRAGPSQGFGPYGQGRPQRGRFTGKGPKGWQRSDESVLERVNETLEQHPEIDATEIEVVCVRGEIVLRGTVDDRRAKRLAEDAIESLPGVKDVRNEIRVQARHDEQRSVQQGGAQHGAQSAPQSGAQQGARSGQQGDSQQNAGRDDGGSRSRSERP
jgi:hypothetical protein